MTLRYDQAAALGSPIVDGDIACLERSPFNLGAPFNKFTMLQLATYIQAKLTSPAYVLEWNATTNTPTLASGVGVTNAMYIVSVAGITNIDGNNNWHVGDILVFNGSVWQKTAIVVESRTQSMSSKTIYTSLFSTNGWMADFADPTKLLNFDLTSNGTGITTTLKSQNSANAVITLPLSTSTLASLDLSETFTNKSMSGSANTFTNIANASLVHSSFTINSILVNLGDTVTISSATPNALLSGYGLKYVSGDPSFDGSVAETIEIDTATTVDLSTAQAVSGKTFSGCEILLSEISVPSTIFVDGIDNTKDLGISLSGKTSGTAVNLVFTGGAQTITSPTGDFTQVGVDLTQTLTAKTLNNCFIWSTTPYQDSSDATKQLVQNLSGKTTGHTTTFSYSGTDQTVTVPATDFTLAGLALTQAFTNKELITGSVTFNDTSDQTKVGNFDLSSVTTGKTCTIKWTATDDQVVTVPDGTGGEDFTIVGAGLAQTVINKLLGNSQIDSTTLTTACWFIDNADATKLLKFNLAGMTTASTSNFIVNGIVNVTFPPGTYSVASTNTVNTYTAAQRGAFSTLTDASTITPDFSLANNYNLVLTGNHTLGVPTNLGVGQSGVISVRQDITGSRTLAYAWVYQFPIGVAPVLSTAKLAFDQLYYSVNSYSTSTVTMTVATPCVVTWTAHGLVSGQRIQLTTSGALPTGLTVSTTYWITVIDANTFNLSTSLANAQAATFIATSGFQSGTHTATNASITITSNLSIA